MLLSINTNKLKKIHHQVVLSYLTRYGSTSVPSYENNGPSWKIRFQFTDLRSGSGDHLIQTSCHGHMTSGSPRRNDDHYHLAKRGQMCEPLLRSSRLHRTTVWTGRGYHKNGVAGQLALKTRHVNLMKTFSK
jgi:hypothetical protein